MKLYVTMFLIGGGIIPIALHVIAADRMPWWPDTVTTGIGFGAFAVAMVWKVRTDREMNRRLWQILVRLAGLEPATSWFVARRSIQLS
jgi:hypothetical protein